MSTVNPVDFMVHKTGLSRAELTARHGLGKNLLLRASQGRVQSITPKIEMVLWKEWKARGIDQDLFDSEYRTLSLDHAFQTWRDRTRKARQGLVPAQVPQDPAIPPFYRIVNAIGSLSATAKLLMVADLPVDNYAKAQTVGMPEPIFKALTDLKYPHISELDKAQKAWQEAH